MKVMKIWKYKNTEIWKYTIIHVEKIYIYMKN